MRITNNIILHNTSSNINGNKVNVDKLNQQMSSQKKIQRPSEDPVVAIRALRLRSNLSEIEQYYERNIPDAESWLEVTETALENMKNILKDIRTQCEYGASDQITTEDRETILNALEKLRAQVYAEGNADYAGRTVFTGYRTNKNLTFMENETDTKYEITQKFTYSDLEEHRYYGNEVTMPQTESDILNNAIEDPTDAAFERIRLAYGEIDSLAGETAGANPGDPATVELTYTDKTGADKTVNATVYDTYEDWLAASGNGTYEIADGEAVVIRNSGEMIFSASAAAAIKSDEAQFEIGYTKTGFDKGEVRPEYYYDCKNVTDPAKILEYKQFDDEGNRIYQDIEYVVAANQTLTVNTLAADVFDTAIGRDVDEMIDAVTRAKDANQKVDDIKKMMDMEEYASDECQARLEDWLAAAKKEADYADDNLQKLYNTYIGNFDDYMEKVILAQTDVGSKGQSLDLTKNRMANQQTTMEELMSKNEDRELSDIIIDYTSAYSAYQASLQAASKVNQVTLLSYL